MPKKKKKGVPVVLWRIFRDRARTLAHTILSLLPPPRPEAECRCKGRRCLGCSGVDAASFLLRRNDPHDYKRLLLNCFVVIDLNAPPLLDFYPDCHWSQEQIVARTIEMIICEKMKTANVLCDGYDKWQHNCLTAVTKLLTSSAWCLLLERIGDDLMVYILKHASIFFPLHKKHLQVAGFPINKLRLESPKNTTHDQDQHSLPGYGPQKKRKRVHNHISVLDGQENHSSFSLNAFSYCISCVDCRSASHIRPFIRCHQCNSSPMGSSEVGSPRETSSIDIKSNLKGELLSNGGEMNCKKRRRPFRWQRHKKHRKIISTTISSDIDRLSEKSPCDVKSSLSPVCEMVPPHCTCCFMFSALDFAKRRIQIDRKPMFYSLRLSSSVFPRTCILWAHSEIYYTFVVPYLPSSPILCIQIISYICALLCCWVKGLETATGLE